MNIGFRGKDPLRSTQKSLSEGLQGSKPWKFAILRPVLGLLKASRGVFGVHLDKIKSFHDNFY